MREARFLKQHAEKWKQYERERNIADADVSADRFVELTDDLAYAKTFYPNSNTSKYLNGLAASFHQKIYQNRKERSGRIIDFWQFELPYLFRRYHRQLLYSFLFFIVFTFLGVLSAKYDDAFIRLILGNDYVNMTNENIAKGKPFDVYARGGQMSMFTMIATNNIRVAFLAFIFGIFFSIGTVLLLMHNGLMLGSFEYYFFSKGLGLKSVLVVFLHGTLEISAIVIAGAAGLVIGSSVLFPGTYGRGASVIRGGRDGLKIVFGLIPVFVAAAFIESFLTRYTQMPMWLSATVLVLSLAFITWYFIIYPVRLHKLVGLFNSSGGEEGSKNFKVWLNKKLSLEK